MWEKKIISFEVCLILSFSWQPKEHMCLFPAAHASSKCLFAICWKKKKMLCQYYSSSKLHYAPGRTRTKQRWDWGGASSLVCSISVHLFHSDGVNTSALLHRCRSLQVSQRLKIALYWCEITRLSLTHSLPGRRRPVFLPAFFFPYTHTHTHTHVTKRPRAHLHL